MINDLILGWASDRGILDEGTVEGQMSKLQEEFDELKDAISRNHPIDIADAIGDMQTVLIILAGMKGLDANECLRDVYGILYNRKGKMQNGVFVKE